MNQPGTAPRIGELLKNASKISNEMIDFALQVQKATHDRLGESLVKLGFVTESEVAQALAAQAGLGFINLEGIRPEGNVLALLPYQIAKKTSVLPLLEMSGHPVFAIADPFKTSNLQVIKKYLPEKHELMVAPANRLEKAIEYYYYLNENPLDKEVAQFTNNIQAGNAIDAERLVYLLDATAIELSASDMHINPTAFATLVSYRVDGVLQLRYAIPVGVHDRIVSIFKIAAHMDIAEMHRPQDGRSTFDFLGSIHDLRVSCIPTAHGDNLVIRFLSNTHELKSLEDLGFGRSQVKLLTNLVQSPNGIILCTGPTGSGKSTTLFAMLRKINSMEKNVLTIEDPVEYELPLIRQVSVNEKANLTFSSAIRSFLRQDPDVILVGEVRDSETATQAVRAAQTGHLVLTTLHTNDAIGAIARLRDLDINSFLLASTISCVISQRLVRKLCEFCRQRVRISGENVKRLNLKSNIVYRHKGCHHCHDTGYRGRTVIAEILEIDNDVRALIDKNASVTDIRVLVEKKGMITMRESTKLLVDKGITDIAEFDRTVNTDFNIS